MNTDSRNSWNIFLACALGAFVGALVSLDLTVRFAWGKYLWFVGAGIGGAVGWVASGPKEVWWAFLKALKEELRPQCHVEWRNLKSGLQLGTLLLLYGVPVFLAAAFLPVQPMSPEVIAMICLVGILGIAVSLFGVTVSVCFCHASWPFLSKLKRILEVPRSTDRPDEVALALLVYGNPIILILSLFFFSFLLLCGLIKLSWLGIKGVPKVFRLACRVAKKVFIRVHSERRLICFVDSALGATIGYFYGNAFVGALAGGILGVANFWLISVRWLKLAPAR